jgi:hypothetical protein
MRFAIKVALLTLLAVGGATVSRRSLHPDGRVMPSPLRAVSSTTSARLGRKCAVERFLDLGAHISCRCFLGLLPRRRRFGPGRFRSLSSGWRCLGPVSYRLRRGLRLPRRGGGPRSYVALLRPRKTSRHGIRVPSSRSRLMRPHLGSAPVIPPLRNCAARTLSGLRPSIPRIVSDPR